MINLVGYIVLLFTFCHLARGLLTAKNKGHVCGQGCEAKSRSVKVDLFKVILGKVEVLRGVEVIEVSGDKVVKVEACSLRLASKGCQ